MTDWVLSVLHDIGTLPFWVLLIFGFLSAFVELVFPPYPGQTVILAFGFLAGSQASLGHSALWLMLMFLLGTFAGSVLVYEIGRAKGKSVLEWKFVHFFISHKELLRGEKIAHKFGTWAVFLAKFIPGIGALAVLLTGVFGLKRSRILMCLGLTATVHSMALFWVGRTVGESRDKIAEFGHTYNVVVWWVVGILLAAWITTKIIAWRKEKKEQSQSEGPTDRGC